MSNLKGCYMSNTDNWRTPSRIFSAFMRAGFVDCFSYMSKQDELKNEYHNQKLYINPPYSQISRGGVLNWVVKQAKQNNIIWLLIPARTDTKKFRFLIDQCGEHLQLIFITGRLKFNDSKNSAPFPSVFVVISPEIKQGQQFSIMSESELLNDLEEYLK